MKVADDKKVKAMYALFEDEIEQEQDYLLFPLIDFYSGV
jgi:hypothetical protein